MGVGSASGSSSSSSRSSSSPSSNRSSSASRSGSSERASAPSSTSGNKTDKNASSSQTRGDKNPAPSDKTSTKNRNAAAQAKGDKNPASAKQVHEQTDRYRSGFQQAPRPDANNKSPAKAAQQTAKHPPTPQAQKSPLKNLQQLIKPTVSSSKALLGKISKAAFGKTSPVQLSQAAAPLADLKRGAKGAEVKQLQDALVKLGYMTHEQVGTGPGTFGPKTEAAVARFQQDHGIDSNQGLYGPKTRAALTGALGGTGGKPIAAPIQSPKMTGPDAAMAVRINNMLKNSGLQGQGEHILAMSKKYNVPPELALAMFQKEGTWNTKGAAPKNNNPGNLRFAAWEEQLGAVRNGGFAKFPSVEKGVEAYFRLLGSSSYRQFIDNKDWKGMVNKYAPPSENDSGTYLNQITGWMNEYRSQINN
jgi:hypothetical protein